MREETLQAVLHFRHGEPDVRVELRAHGHDEVRVADEHEEAAISSARSIRSDRKNTVAKRIREREKTKRREVQKEISEEEEHDANFRATLPRGQHGQPLTQPPYALVAEQPAGL
jgi:hypothetical protein